MNKPFDIVIVEDNAGMRLGMEESLRRDGLTVHAFERGDDALKHVETHPTSIVITDLKMEPMSGLDVLKRVKSVSPSTAVLVVTAFGTVETAVEAMQAGAADFLTKPFSQEELRFRVDQLRQRLQNERDLNRLRDENAALHADLHHAAGDMIGDSTAMKNLHALIDKVAGEDSTVLIEGESGTGKELVARALHRKSARASGPFIKVNCGALHDGLLESELFGHEKGAFTGAVRMKKGRFELADGGTLFLDEIGDISPAMQVKLLRVLQEREFERVGGEETLSVDVRIIAATHRDLGMLVRNESFREDLYYRLRVIPITLSSLRQRREDIPLLVRHFLRQHADRRKEPPKRIDSAGMELLTGYSWPGNIRELEHVIERMCIMSSGDVIETDLIARQVSGSSMPAALSLDGIPLDEAVEAFERRLIVEAMKKTGHNKNQAAKRLGIKTSTLYYKLEKFGLL
jgi:DNA-binding NtrC family response regulator